MEILPVVKLMDQDLEPLEAEMESDGEGEPPTQTEVKEVVEEIVPEVKPKDTIPEEDIFVEKKKTTPPPKKKRVMTEAQKENLKRGREKALAVRRAKAEEKKKMKELENKEKELVKKAKVKRVQKLEEEISDKPQKHIDPTLPTSLQALDPDLIRKLQQDAIEGYDKIRKERKAKKKQEEANRHRDQVNMNVINNALNPPKSAKYGEAGFFSHLF